MNVWNLVLFWALLASGCSESECDTSNGFALEPGETTGPEMRPGNNCLRCHQADGEAASAVFSFGGTVFPTSDANPCDGVPGVTIRVTDSLDRRVTVVSNAVGNFWSAEPLTPPLRMEAEYQGRVAVMPVTAPTGGCALCHSWPDRTSGAAGRIRIP